MDGIEEVSNNSNKVKVHQRPAEGVGQKEAEPMLAAVRANQLLLLQLVGSKAKMVVKTSLHQRVSDNPVVGAVEQVGVATGGAVVAQAEVAHRRQKERQMLLPLKREVHNRCPSWTVKKLRK